jgi:HAE1 family hydrophobic/amphiphilic exporter-1
MNFSRAFIERPVMTTLAALAVLMGGVLGYRALPVAALPSVDYPTIQVNAGLPGADPETMASAVATPLEREFSTIAGVKQMSSTNTRGSTSVTVQFDLSRKIDEGRRIFRRRSRAPVACCRRECRALRRIRR